MKKIVNIYPANAPQSTIPALKARLDPKGPYVTFDNIFIVFGKIAADYVEDYITLETEFCGRVIICETPWSLVLTLKRFKANLVVSHSDSYWIRFIPKLVGAKTVWVCWGAHTTQSGTLLSKLSYPIKYAINHSMHTIIALMIADKNDLVQTFKLNNVMVLPYASLPTDNISSKEYFDRERNNKLKVLIGNSGHCYKWYVELLNDLCRFKGLIEVHCMFQYPSLPDKVTSLKLLGESLFGDSFFVDTSMMVKDEYYSYIASFDIYMCPKPTQSGLGAIHTALYFGKKVYATGKNLEWENFIGVKIYDTKSAKSQSFNEFETLLEYNEKIKNRELIYKHWDRTEEWLNFFSNL